MLFTEPCGNSCSDKEESIFESGWLEGRVCGGVGSQNALWWAVFFPSNRLHLLQPMGSFGLHLAKGSMASP